MQHMLLENIQWDTDGMRPVEDCNLPVNVLAINVPGRDRFSENDIEFYLDVLLSETYGFLHYGFTLRGIKLDDPGTRQDKPWGVLAQAVLNAEE